MRMTALLVGLSVAVPSTAQAQRLEAGGFITYAFLEQIGSTDHGIGTSTLGLGGRAVWHVVRFVDLDGALLLARDRLYPLRYEGSRVHPPSLALWG